jgi:hypothetical protein
MSETQVYEWCTVSMHSNKVEKHVLSSHCDSGQEIYKQVNMHVSRMESNTVDTMCASFPLFNSSDSVLGLLSETPLIFHKAVFSVTFLLCSKHLQPISTFQVISFVKLHDTVFLTIIQGMFVQQYFPVQLLSAFIDALVH